MHTPWPHNSNLSPRKMRRISARKREVVIVFFKRPRRRSSFALSYYEHRYLYLRRKLDRLALQRSFVKIGPGVWYDPNSDYNVTVSSLF